MLIPANIGREVDINNHAYCILERIGRARYFGETTSGPYSLNDYVKDNKLLHYFRTCLLKNELVIRQQFNQRINPKKVAVAMLFHIPKYYILIQTTIMRHTERLFAHLLTKETHAAPLEEIRNILGIGQKTTLSFLRNRSEIFEYRQFFYREIFPKSSKAEYTLKKGDKEKKIHAVKLVDPNYDIFRLYDDTIDEKDVISVAEEEEGFLDCSNQMFNRPLLIQVIRKIEESKGEGMSQSDIGRYFGLSKLNARAVIRKVLKYGITFYMKDEGRQRASR